MYCKHSFVKLTFLDIILPGFVKSNLWDARDDGAVDSRRNEACFPFRTHVVNKDRHFDDEDAISPFVRLTVVVGILEFRLLELNYAISTVFCWQNGKAITLITTIKSK